MAMVRIGIVLCGLLTGVDQPKPYDRFVEIVKAQAVPAPGAAHRHVVEITFNLVPDLPKGVKIQFELQRQGEQVGDPMFYTLENETRKGLKIAWKPKDRLTTDKYVLVTRIPLADQTPEVRQALSAKPTRFPPDSDPWPFSHVQKEFQVGTAEDEAAEAAEVKKFVEDNVEKLLALNNEGVEELEKHLTGKFNQEALKKYLTGWMVRMGQVQREVNDFQLKEPGLFTKHQKLHHELAQLGRMVGKRITKIDLGGILKKNNIATTAFPLPSAPGFDGNFPYLVNGPKIKQQYEMIDRLLNPEGTETAEKEGAEEGAEKDSKPAANSKKGEAQEEGKTEGSKPDDPSPDPKKAGKDKPGTTGKSSREKKKTGAGTEKE
jgi:hypothetical protein